MMLGRYEIGVEFQRFLKGYSLRILGIMSATLDFGMEALGIVVQMFDHMLDALFSRGGICAAMQCA